MSPGPIARPMLAVLTLVSLALVSCGDDGQSTTSSSTTVPTTAPTTTVPPTTAPPTTAAPTTTVPLVTQPAMWPAADVVFATPEEAAADFVSQVLGVPPELGEFMAGDQRSGEIEVFSPGEGGPGSRVVRGLLLLRMLGPDDGWFVIGAVSEGVSITSPEAGGTVPAASLDVVGRGRGYEATLIVKVYLQGSATPLLEPVIATGGALETPEPYTARLDLSSAPAGSRVLLLVRGDTGLETDPGEFSAIPLEVG